MDTNPMVQGNDTLTDCLNGTLITMNGNEVILQNDMGNRRVDSAFLPSGYQPVGMKEYGGVIYVAAYNPITNKSQIGSFPSPQRKISTETDGEATKFNFSSFINNGIVEQDSFLKPLTKDNVLHAGDKFTIYANGLSEMRDKLTNYDNVVTDDHTKAKTPKNRLYTISIGILNSQNEFVDITKSLVRWDDWNQVRNSESDWSDIYKFNVGYFIPDEFNGNLSETIADSKLIKERQKLATNTYAYKLAGPLYLKVELNHIQTFDYNITGTYDSGKANLQIEAYITYNCPDNAQEINNDVGNTSYKTFEEGLLNFGVFDFIKKNVDESQQILEQDPNIGIKIERSVYNPNTNLYSAKITKSYTDVSPSDGNILNYHIGVIPNADSDYQNVYLKGLSVDDSIDLSLLNSGKVFIKEWKFYNNIDYGTTTLKLGMSAYPVLGTEFKNLRFEFIDHGDNSKKFYFPNGEPEYINGKPWFKTDKTVNNGRQILEFNWNQIGLEKNKLYEVKIYYDICEGLNTDYKQLEELDGTQRWFLTTELFNDLFNDPEVTDYCTETSQKFKDKLQIQLGINDDNVTFEISKSDPQFYGGFIKKKTYENENIEYSCEQEQLLNIYGKAKLKIINENLYPDYVKVRNNGENLLSFGTTLNNTTLDLYSNGDIKNKLIEKGLLDVSGPGNKNLLRDKLFFDALVTKHSPDHISCRFRTRDYFVSNGILLTGTIINAFGSFKEVIKSFTNYKYGGIQLRKDQIGGGTPDRHWVFLRYNYSVDVADTNPGDLIELDGHASNSPQTFWLSESIEQLFDKFNDYRYRNKGQVFMYIYPYSKYQNNINPDIYCENYHYYYLKAYSGQQIDDPTNYNQKIKAFIYTDNYNYKYTTRVWFKTDSDKWVLINNFINRGSNNGLEFSNDVKSDDFLNNLFSKDYIYRVYDNYEVDSNDNLISVNKDNYLYFNDYNFNLDYKIMYTFSTGNDIDNVQEFGQNYGNLIFKKATNIENDSKTFTINIKSSEQFQDSVKNYLNNSQISGIDLSTGLQIDSNGNPLDINGIYYKENGKLIKIKNPKLTILRDEQIEDNTNRGNNKNVLVLKSSAISTGIPDSRYDVSFSTNLVFSSDNPNIYGSSFRSDISGSDGTVYLDYKDVPLIDKI